MIKWQNCGEKKILYNISSSFKKTSSNINNILINGIIYIGGENIKILKLKIVIKKKQKHWEDEWSWLSCTSWHNAC